MRFSIKAVLCLTAAFALVIAYGVWERDKALVRAKAIAFVDEAHGTYGIDFNRPEWFRKLLINFGADHKGFYEPLRVSFGPTNQGYDSRNPFNDSSLQNGAQHLASFTKLELFEVFACVGVTDEGIQFFPNPPSLKHIRVTGTSISDKGLELLRKKYPNVEIEH